jgi:cytoskeletal protein CcmA (bactofilin family)
MFKKSDLDDGRTKPVIQSSEQNSLSKSSGRTPTTIGPTIKIVGDVLVTGNQGVHIEGQVEGTISLSDNILSVGTEGKIDATINARAIFVAGKVEGDLKGDEQVVVQSSGKVRGNIVAPRVTLEDGCTFKGFIDTDVNPGEARASKRSSKNEKVADINLAAGGSGDESSRDRFGTPPGP